MTGNFVKLRRGLLEHLRDGRLTPLEFAAYVAIILSADKSTGVWIGSSIALAATMAGAIGQRAAQQVLATLAEKGYIKNFRQQGQRHNQPILVNRYLITSGVLTGCVVNAAESTDWRKPAVFLGSEDSSEVGSEVSSETRSEVRTYSRRPRLQDLKNTRSQVVAVAGSGSARPTSKADRDPAERVTSLLLHKVLELKPEQIDEVMLARCLKYARSLVASRDYDCIKAVLAFAKQDSFWLEKISQAGFPMAMFAKSFDSIEAQMNRPRPVVKAKPKSVRPKLHDTKPEGESVGYYERINPSI